MTRISDTLSNGPHAVLLLIGGPLDGTEAVLPKDRVFDLRRAGLRRIYFRRVEAAADQQGVFVDRSITPLAADDLRYRADWASMTATYEPEGEA